MITSSLLKIEAQRLLDVAIDAKISNNSSNYLKSLLENVSIEFSTHHDSLSDGDHLVDNDNGSQSDDNIGNIDSPDLELSLASDDNEESSFDKKQLLMKILAYPSSKNPDLKVNKNDDKTVTFQQSDIDTDTRLERANFHDKDFDASTNQRDIGKTALTYANNIYVYIYMYIYMYIYIYFTCIYTHIFTYIYIYIMYIYTNTI
jgi:hypothetical protein